MDAGGVGDPDAAAVQPGFLDERSDARRGRLDPAQSRGQPGQLRRETAVEVEEHLGLGQPAAEARLLVRRSAEAGLPAVVGGEAWRREQVRLVDHAHAGDGLDAAHVRRFEVRGDEDGGDVGDAEPPRGSRPAA
jgi:hypothetical protein